MVAGNARLSQGTRCEQRRPMVRKSRESSPNILGIIENDSLAPLEGNKSGGATAKSLPECKSSVLRSYSGVRKVRSLEAFSNKRPREMITETRSQHTNQHKYFRGNSCNRSCFTEFGLS